MQFQKIQQLRLTQSRAPYYGGSLPNVNQISNTSTEFQVGSHHSHMTAWNVSDIRFHVRFTQDLGFLRLLWVFSAAVSWFSHVDASSHQFVVSCLIFWLSSVCPLKLPLKFHTCVAFAARQLWFCRNVCLCLDVPFLSGQIVLKTHQQPDSDTAVLFKSMRRQHPFTRCS